MIVQVTLVRLFAHRLQSFVVAEVFVARPSTGHSGASAPPEDLIQLFDLIVGLEEHLFRYQFCEDDPGRPDVNGRSIVTHTEEQFRTAIPQRDDLAGVSLPLPPIGVGFAK